MDEKAKRLIETEEEIYGIRYEQLIPPLGKAIQELSSQNALLKERIIQLEERKEI